MRHPAEFLLRLRATADPSDQDGTRRLRAALKRLLRGYGLRAVEVQRVAGVEALPAPEVGMGVRSSWPMPETARLVSRVFGWKIKSKPPDIIQPEERTP